MPDDVKVLVVCGTGIATSTILLDKLENFFRDNDIKATIIQGRTSEALSFSQDVDMVVSTTHLPTGITCPVIRGTSLVTGIGEEETMQLVLDTAKNIMLNKG